MTHLEAQEDFSIESHGHFGRHGEKKIQKKEGSRKRSSSASLKADVRLRKCCIGGFAKPPRYKKNTCGGEQYALSYRCFFAQVQNYINKTIDLFIKM